MHTMRAGGYYHYAIETHIYVVIYIYIYPDEAILQRKLQGYIPAILPTESSM